MQKFPFVHIQLPPVNFIVKYNFNKLTALKTLNSNIRTGGGKLIIFLNSCSVFPAVKFKLSFNLLYLLLVSKKLFDKNQG